MDKREKVIKGLECCLTDNPSICEGCPYLETGCLENVRSFKHDILRDALALLKAQEPLTVEPKRIDLEEETKAWLDKMDAVDALANIANICMDWDGYRTADGLGGLVNEIWAYARYCAERLLKAREPRVMTLEEIKAFGWDYCYLEELRLPGKEYRAVCGDYVLTCITWPCIASMRIQHGDGSYNKTWRCWTSSPTDEQRKAVPWET